MSAEVVDAFINGNYNFVIVEYDFKYCAYRSERRHLLETGNPCDCHKTEHGQKISDLFTKAKMIYWMSERQGQIVESKLPALAKKNSLVISSVFDDETLDILATFRHKRVIEPRTTGVLGSGSWIKGIEQTLAWCKLRNKNVVSIADKDYKSFLTKLAKVQELVFMPQDYDTCPRVTIEAKLMGIDLTLNDNVLHKNEVWFSGSVETTDLYLRQSAADFWDSFTTATK